MIILTDRVKKEVGHYSLVNLPYGTQYIETSDGQRINLRQIWSICFEFFIVHFSTYTI